MRAESLARAIGSHKVLSEIPQRKLYRYDGIAVGELPSLVVLPETVSDVVEVVRFAQAAPGGPGCSQRTVGWSFPQQVRIKKHPPPKGWARFSKLFEVMA